MSLSIRDEEEYYYKTISVDDSTDLEGEVSSFVQDLEVHSESLNCQITNDGEYVTSFEIDGFDDLKLPLSLIEDKRKVTLELKCEKKSDRVLRIINPCAFVNYLAEKELSLQLKFWLNQLSDKYDSVLIEGKDIDLTSYKEHSTAEFIERHKKDTIVSLIGVKMNVCFFDFLLVLFDKFEILSAHLLEMRTILCLCLISRSCNLSLQTFEFDGDNQIILTNIERDFIINKGVAVYLVFKWAYNDERLSARIGIINQVISQSKSVTNFFKISVINVLDSVYQIYIKEDFEQYIEVQNRVSDATLNLCNQINGAVSASRATIKQSIFVIFSYFFSIVVFTAVDNVFTLELTVLSSVFLVAGFLNVWISNNEKNKSVRIYKHQLDEIKIRNDVFLSEKEISDFFYSKSLTESISVAESKSYLYVSFFLLTILMELLWTFHLVKN
jgi:hypothetical protein